MCVRAPTPPDKTRRPKPTTIIGTETAVTTLGKPTIRYPEMFTALAPSPLRLASPPQFKEPITDIKTGVDEPYKIIAKVTGAPS